MGKDTLHKTAFLDFLRKHQFYSFLGAVLRLKYFTCSKKLQNLKSVDNSNGTYRLKMQRRISATTLVFMFHQNSRQKSSYEPFFAVRSRLMYMAVFFGRLERMSHQLAPCNWINVSTAPLDKLIEVLAPSVKT